MKPKVPTQNTLSKILLPISMALVVGIIIFISTAISIYTYSQKQTSCSGDAALVLGAAVLNNEPSPVFAERINHAIDLYNNKKVQKILFTGGVGEDDEISEAEAAKQYATARGVAEKDILLEEISRTTYQNLRNSLHILTENNINNVVIISDPLHLKRAERMATELGINSCTSATPTTRYRSTSAKLDFLMRETYFYLQHYFVKI